MKIELKVNGLKQVDDIWELKDLIAEKNIGGLKLNVAESPSQAGTMSGSDYLPIIQMVLGSTVVSAAVKGLFDVIKGYFDLQKQKTDLEKTRITENKIEFEFHGKDGVKNILKFNSFDEKERAHFFDMVDNALKTE